MKKNITINLCGRLYQIDEDAYELLSQYLDALRNYFKKQDGGEEIANDIEERVAELFDNLKVQGIEAITIEHVQDIIQRIEGNTLSLEDSVREFERGMNILNGLETELGDLNRKITVLRTGKDGTPEETPQGGER